MKYINKYFCFCCFALCATLLSGVGFYFAYNGNNAMVSSVYASDVNEDFIEIGSVSAFKNIKSDKNYILTDNLNFINSTFESIENFNGVFDGNGFSISNLTIKIKAVPTNYNFGIFGSTNNAVIKNLKLDNINFVNSIEGDGYIQKIGILVGSAKNTVFENICIENSKIEFPQTKNDDKSSVTLNSNNAITADPVVDCYTTSSLYAGLLCAEMSNGSKVLDCLVSGDISLNKFNGTSSKSYYIGGIAGYVGYSSICNLISNANISTLSVPDKNYVSLGIGYLVGDTCKIINVIVKGAYNNNDFENVVFGNIVAYISYSQSCLKTQNFNYLYCLSDTNFVGNFNEIDLNHKNGVINFNIANCKINSITDDLLGKQEFFTNRENFDTSFYPWDFVNIWEIDAELSYPKLQWFSTYNFSVNIEDSFTEFDKPILADGSDVVVSLGNTAANFEYNEKIVFGGYISTTQSVNKLIDIVGFSYPDDTDYENSRIFDVVKEELLISTDDKGIKTFSNGDYSIIVEENSTHTLISSADVVKYVDQAKNVTLFVGDVNGQQRYVYEIAGTTKQNTGEYKFHITSCFNNIKIKSADAQTGLVGRSDAKLEDTFSDEIYYNKDLDYIAKPAAEYEFSGWYVGEITEDSVPVSESKNFKFKYNEELFKADGILAGGDIDDLTVTAVFTKNITQIKIIVVVNNEIQTVFLPKIYIDKNYGEQFVYDNIIEIIEDEYIEKATKNSKFALMVEVPSDYEFVEWYISNENGDFMETLGTELISDAVKTGDADTVFVVAKFSLEKENNSKTFIIVISIVGGVLALAGIVVAIVFAVKRRGSKFNYKRGYY